MPKLKHNNSVSNYIQWVSAYVFHKFRVKILKPRTVKRCRGNLIAKLADVQTAIYFRQKLLQFLICGSFVGFGFQKPESPDFITEFAPFGI
jgi:hypothetical protein